MSSLELHQIKAYSENFIFIFMFHTRQQWKSWFHRHEIIRENNPHFLRAYRHQILIIIFKCHSTLYSFCSRRCIFKKRSIKLFIRLFLPSQLLSQEVDPIDNADSAFGVYKMSTSEHPLLFPVSEDPNMSAKLHDVCRFLSIPMLDLVPRQLFGVP
jgi:hypothetical protein